MQAKSREELLGEAVEGGSDQPGSSLEDSGTAPGDSGGGLESALEDVVQATPIAVAEPKVDREAAWRKASAKCLGAPFPLVWGDKARSMRGGSRDVETVQSLRSRNTQGVRRLGERVPATGASTEGPTETAPAEACSAAKHAIRQHRLV